MFLFLGIFLHIVADTLGSVGVIVSSALIQTFGKNLHTPPPTPLLPPTHALFLHDAPIPFPFHKGWMMADPLCSMFIAVLIMLRYVQSWCAEIEVLCLHHTCPPRSVFPLMRESLGVLMQRTPVSLDHILPASLQKVPIACCCIGGGRACTRNEDHLLRRSVNWREC